MCVCVTTSPFLPAGQSANEEINVENERNVVNCEIWACLVCVAHLATTIMWCTLITRTASSHYKIPSLSPLLYSMFSTVWLRCKKLKLGIGSVCYALFFLVRYCLTPSHTLITHSHATGCFRWRFNGEITSTEAKVNVLHTKYTILFEYWLPSDGLTFMVKCLVIYMLFPHRFTSAI